MSFSNKILQRNYYKVIDIMKIIITVKGRHKGGWDWLTRVTKTMEKIFELGLKTRALSWVRICLRILPVSHLRIGQIKLLLTLKSSKCWFLPSTPEPAKWCLATSLFPFLAHFCIKVFLGALNWCHLGHKSEHWL